MRHPISSCQYTDLNPPEVHYLDINKNGDDHRFIAGEIIGRGVAAGGGEGSFTLTEFIKKDWLLKHLKKSGCEWVLPIINDATLSERDRFKLIISRAAEANLS